MSVNIKTPRRVETFQDQFDPGTTNQDHHDSIIKNNFVDENQKSRYQVDFINID